MPVRYEIPIAKPKNANNISWLPTKGICTAAKPTCIAPVATSGNAQLGRSRVQNAAAASNPFTAM